MRKQLLPLAVILAVLLAVSAAGCASAPEQSAPPSQAPVSSAQPSEQPSAEASDETGAPSPEASADTSPGVIIDSETLAPTIDPSDFFVIGDELMQKDGIGPLKVNMTEDALVTAIGQPDSKSDPEMWGADGLEHSTWTYGAAGLEINMAKAPEETASIVYTISAGADCTLATQRGIKIGDSKDAVLTAYAEAIDPTANTDTSSGIIIGSVYGGIVVDIENDVVTGIFIGASAE